MSEHWLIPVGALSLLLLQKWEKISLSVSTASSIVLMTQRNPKMVNKSEEKAVIKVVFELYLIREATATQRK